MTKEELAARLNGREYGEEMTPDDEAQAKADGLVVVFGASDDLMELRGAINDEVGAYEGAEVSVNQAGLVTNDCGDDECPYFAKLQDMAATVTAIWDRDGYSWTYETDIPHSTFEIMEDGDKYCRGIVFSLNQVPA